jgi:type I restriction enzyme S subunit
MKVERKPILEVAEIIMGQSPSGDTYNHIGDGLPLFTTDSKREGKQGDLIFCVRGSTTGRMNWADQIYSLGRGVCAIRGENQLRTKYIKYCLDAYLDGLLQLAGGGTFPNLSRNDIGGFKIPYSDRVEKIASILSAYDDLIENNLKRIKLLEEKAQLHYKELMQEISYSKTKREEYIKDCLAFYIGGGWGEEDYKEKFTEAAYVIRGTDIPDTRIGNISGIPLRFHKESNLASRKMQIGDIAFEVSNGQINNIGRSVLVSQRLLGQFDKPVMCASFAKLIRVNEKISPEFFYLYLNEGQENGLLYQYKSNSANGINNFAFETFIDEVKISIPKETELETFTEKVKPIFTLINTLGEQNTKLREARDILLPRLMSGQIEV